MKSDARPDQPIAFARCLHEALPIKDRDLPSGEVSTLEAGPFVLPFGAAICRRTSRGVSSSRSWGCSATGLFSFDGGETCPRIENPHGRGPINGNGT